MSEEPSEAFGRRRAGQLLFAAGFVIASLVLLAFLPDQTAWKAKTRLFAQPRFWPGVGVAGMAFFGLLHLRSQARALKRRKLVRADWLEARRWAEVLEYAGWFLVYVWLVPRVGYLPTTLIFAPLLTFRLGYRSPRMLWTSGILGFTVVILFKGLLEVKIPGGALYEYLPGALRSFFILHF